MKYLSLNEEKNIFIKKIEMMNFIEDDDEIEIESIEENENLLKNIEDNNNDNNKIMKYVYKLDIKIKEIKVKIIIKRII